MPRNNVIDLLQYIVTYKTTKGKNTKPDYLFPFLNYAASNMSQYQEQVNAGGSPDWRIKEALIIAIGNLTEQINRWKELKTSMEPMLMQHVLPELKSQQPVIRSTACWMYGEFGEFKFKKEDHVKQFVDGVYQNLFAPELPVRLQAATAMAKLLKNDIASEFLKPALKNILEVYLKLMDEVDSEELV